MRRSTFYLKCNFFIVSQTLFYNFNRKFKKSSSKIPSLNDLLSLCWLLVISRETIQISYKIEKSRHHQNYSLYLYEKEKRKKKSSVPCMTPVMTQDMSRHMGKPTICIGENKGTDQLRSNCEANRGLRFRYSDSIFPLLKSEISSF